MPPPSKPSGPKRGPYKLGEDRQSIEQSVSILERFIEPPPYAGKVRIPRLEFEKVLLQMSGPDGPDVTKAFRRSLAGERAPSPQAAWNIGEALRKFEVPWMNGLLMLAICGHVGDAIAISGIWLLRQDDPRRYADRAWHMMALSQTMSLSSGLDLLPGFLQRHLLEPHQPAEFLSDLKARTQTTVAIGGHQITPEDAAIYIARELAKDAWTSYHHHAEVFSVIAREWLKAPEWRSIGKVPEVNTLISAAAAVGRSAELPLQTRQVAGLAMFGHALSTLDAGASLYPRPIAQRYLVSAL